jgi:hypothetical protein
LYSKHVFGEDILEKSSFSPKVGYNIHLSVLNKFATFIIFT